uniref:Uncharacterized protein n=1 Tax=Tanacetum cinerariifolium TaxID=118510 RepID=A0A699GI56_TANCI|nr:hypothetical protein [Tanacetum cinerariifolium]
MDPSSSKTCLGENVIEILSDKGEGHEDWNSPEFQDTANGGGKKETQAMAFHKIETKKISDRFVAPCFVNGLEAYDGEINLGVEENMISNESEVKLCLEHEVKRRNKVVKKELIVALRGKIYFVKFIINPEEDDVEPSVVFGRSCLRLTKAITNFDIDGVDVPQFMCKMRKSSRNKRKSNRNKRKQLDKYQLIYSDTGPSKSTRTPLTQKEAKKDALAISIYERYSILEEERPQLPQKSNEGIKLEMAKLIKNNRILSNVNVFPLEEASMEVLLAKERIFKLIQAWDEKQIESWSLPALLLQLLNDLRTINEMLKQREQTANLAIHQEREEQVTQSFTPYWNFSMIDDEEVLQSREKFMKDIQTFLQKFSRYPFGVMPKVLSIAWERFSEIKYAFTDKQYQLEEIQELMCKLLEDVRNIIDELSEYINSPSWNYPTFYDDEEYSIQYKEYLENSSDAIAPVLPTKEPEYSLSMGYEHLSIIPEMESDEVTESSVKNLLPIPSEYEVTFDDESECDVPVKDESSLVFTNFSNPLFDCNDDFTSSDDGLLSNEDVLMEDFKVYSNPLFDDEEINSDEIDLHYFNAKSDFVESLSNRDTLIDSSLKFNYLEEFSGELMSTSIVNEERIRREHEEYISLMEKLLAINSFPSPLENFHANTIVETLPTSPIPLEDSDSLREEIDIFTGMDDLLPPVVMNNIDELNEDECFNQGGEINVFANVKDDDYFPFIFVIRIFLPYLIFLVVSPLLLSTRNEDTIFDPGISV